MTGPYEANVFETTETQGTGAKTLAGAVTGARTFRTAFGDGPIVVGYVMRNAVEDGTFEEGFGTLAHSTSSTLTPLAVTGSSNSDAAVDWGAGTKNVWCAVPAKAANGFTNLNAGDSAPSPTFPGQPWHDTANDLLKIRNQDDDAWITLGALDESGDTFTPYSGGSPLGTAAVEDVASGGTGDLLRADGSGANLTDIAAGQSSYDNATSGLTATNVQAAIDEVAAGRLKAGTAVAASGGAVDFTSIPAGTKRITVMLAGLSRSGTGECELRIGDSGGVETSGYIGAVSSIRPTSIQSALSSGFPVILSALSAAAVVSGSVVLTLLDSSTNTWSAAWNVGRSDNADVIVGGGHKALSAELDRISLVASGSFDAGTVNILYE